jgi:hypothetical protein
MTIDEKLDLIISLLKAKPAQAAPAEAGGAVASDADMDSDRGNPEVRKDPKYWQGEPQAGKLFSECPPEYLDVIAKDFDRVAAWMDGKGAEGEKDSKGYPMSGKFKRRDASLARGWAKRLRAGWGSQKANAPLEDDTGDLPF